MKYNNSFSLIETVTAIAIITLCIMALLSTYYSIYRLQNMVLYNNTIQRKAETIFFTKIYPNTQDVYIKDNLYIILNQDSDLNKFITVDLVTVTNDNPQILSINISKDTSSQILKKTKKGLTIEIEYTILKTKEKKNTKIYLPEITNSSSDKPSGNSNSNNSKPSYSSSQPF